MLLSLEIRIKKGDERVKRKARKSVCRERHEKSTDLSSVASIVFFFLSVRILSVPWGSLSSSFWEKAIPWSVEAAERNNEGSFVYCGEVLKIETAETSSSSVLSACRRL